MKAIIMDFFYLFPKNATTTQEQELNRTQEGVGFIELYQILEAVDSETVVYCYVLRFVLLSVTEVLVKDLDCEVFRDVGLSLPVVIVKDRFYKFFPTHLQTHSHLMLKVNLNVMSQIAADMNFDLQSSVQSREQFRSTVPLMTNLRPDFASIRAVMYVFAIFAELEGQVVFPTIDALRQDIGSKFIQCNFLIFEYGWTIFPIMIEDNLQVIVV